MSLDAPTKTHAKAARSDYRNMQVIAWRTQIANIFHLIRLEAATWVVVGENRH